MLPGVLQMDDCLKPEVNWGIVYTDEPVVCRPVKHGTQAEVTCQLKRLQLQKYTLEQNGRKET